MKRLLKDIALRFGLDITRTDPNSPKRVVVSLKPKNPNGKSVILSYSVMPFLLKDGDSPADPHDWECLQIAKTFLDLGYNLDVINYDNEHFVPRKEYAFAIDLGRNLERLDGLCGSDCIKILHVVWAHWSFHNTAQYGRLLALTQRKRAVLKPKRVSIPRLGIEHADYAIVLGNEFTLDTYRYAGKPMFRLPNPSTAVFPWPENKDFEKCRNRFVWFGGYGLVHKGLDIVLDAFTELPECYLTVMGPVHEETDFRRLYHKELFETANIRTIGWIDVTSPRFVEIANDSLGVVYPSCSEGTAGSVVTCMHAGLIPIISYESGVDVDGFGVLLRTSSIGEIKNTVRRISSLPREELERRARAAWEHARANHTRERFAEEYQKIIKSIVTDRRTSRT